MKGIYAGSFDPPTNGHLWMFDQGSKLFDEFVIAIGINAEKEYTFSIDERISMLKELTKNYANVEVVEYENQFLINYANSIGSDYILRGIRNENDYTYERGMRYINGDLNKNIQTLFLIPPRNLVEVSSSFVKGIIGPEGWEEIIKEYVPKSVFLKIIEKECI